MPLDVRLSGKVCAYLVSRNSQPVVKKSPANVIPRPAGGADSAPPLSNIRDNLRTT